jgi:hypothetical protein
MLENKNIVCLDNIIPPNRFVGLHAHSVQGPCC